MSAVAPPFLIRHARWVLLLAILNLSFALVLWLRGIAVVGVILAAGIPLAVLLCLYWILRDGHFFDPKREEDDPERLVSYDTKPKHYWTIVILCGLVYSGMTFLTGVAAIVGR
jgi:hypothetical protein